MGLTVSVDKAGFPKLGYDRVYLDKDGWSRVFKSANAVDEAVAPHNWEKIGRNVVHKGFSAGVRQFTILCDVCDASYGITWLVDASKGIEYVKAVLALEFGLVRTELELAFPPDNDNINNSNKLVICGKDRDLVGAATSRFCVLLKSQVRDLFQVVCVDRYGAFCIYRTLSESDESFFLKVLKLRGLRVTASALIPRANHWPSYNKALFLRGNYVCWQVRDEARTACELGNYATSLLS